MDVRRVLDGDPRLKGRRLASLVQQLREVGADRERLSVEEVLRRLSELADRHSKFDLSRIEMMRGYAELRSCRRNYVLDYFGESRTEPCGNCDNCEAGLSARTLAPSKQPFEIGSQVAHTSFGAGTVVRYEDDQVVVLFQEAGYKSLSLALVLQEKLLRPAEGASRPAS